MKREVLLVESHDTVLKNGTVAVIGLIHDSRHVGFQIVMQISHVLCWGQTLEKGQIAENRLVEILK